MAQGLNRLRAVEVQQPERDRVQEAFDDPGQATDRELLDSLHSRLLPPLSNRPRHRSTPLAEASRGSVSTVAKQPFQRVGRAGRGGPHPARTRAFVGL